MKIKLTLLAFAILATASGALGQTEIIPPGAGTSTAIRPDSIGDGSLYGYFTGSDAGTVSGSLVGKVSIAGDPLIWDPTPVNVLCLGKIVYTAYAGPKGGFAISPTSVKGAISTEGDIKRQMETHYDGCTVTAALTGFTSSSVTLAVHNFRDSPDIGTLTLTRIADAKAYAVSSTSKEVSPKSIKLFEKARSEWEAQNLDHVKGELQEAVAADPKFAEAWYQLGKLEQSTSPDQAREDFTKAAAADPLFIRPYEQLLLLDSQQGKWHDSLTDGAHALSMEPRGTAQIWYVYAEGILKAYAAGALPDAKLKFAEVSATNSLKLDPQHTIPAEQLLALVLSEEKNYSAAINHLQHCLTYLPKGSSSDQVKQQIAQLEQKNTAPAQ